MSFLKVDPRLRTKMGLRRRWSDGLLKAVIEMCLEESVKVMEYEMGRGWVDEGGGCMILRRFYGDQKVGRREKGDDDKDPTTLRRIQLPYTIL